MRYFFIAGEKSGDLHGSNLISALRKLEPNSILKGYGGDLMQSSGMELLHHYKTYSVMGFVEVFKKAITIRRFIKSAKKDIIEFKPDVLILIDFGGFNMRVASFAKKASIKVVYYIPPKVWAWNVSRAKKLKENVDLLLAILPFEQEFYKKLDWDIQFVGNPVNDEIKKFTPNPDFASLHGVENAKCVALLPGSRAQEVSKISGLFLELAQRYPKTVFLLAGVSNLSKEYYSPFESAENIKVIFDETYNIISCSNAAIVTSGTATLETALLGTPQLVVYKTNPVSYSIAKRVIKVPYISLVNLILDKELVRELIQSQATFENVVLELELLLTDNNYRTRMIDGYNQIKTIMGEGSASENAAEAIITKFSS